MENHLQTVILDFDYTLADSSKGVIDCINSALEKMGFSTVSAEAACRTIGLSLSDTFRTLVGAEHPNRANEFTRLFIQRADDVMVDQTVLFDPVPRTVELLKKCGLSLGIVSTKYRYRIEAILRREKLLDSFDIIIGGEDVPEHKPDPRGLLTAMAKLGSSPSQCLYVGDSVTDAETAQRARTPFVAVLSGVTPREDFNSYDVYRILDGISELPQMIEGSRASTSGSSPSKATADAGRRSCDI